jgi:hypothetical protein
MKKIVLNDPKEGCQHQEMILLILFAQRSKAGGVYACPDVAGRGGC